MEKKSKDIVISRRSGCRCKTQAARVAAPSISTGLPLVLAVMNLRKFTSAAATYDGPPRWQERGSDRSFEHFVSSDGCYALGDSTAFGACFTVKSLMSVLSTIAPKKHIKLKTVRGR
eukprot:4719149-Amphidinium_carterae.1